MEDELAERVLEEKLLDVAGVVRPADVRAMRRRLIKTDVLELRRIRSAHVPR